MATCKDCIDYTECNAVLNKYGMKLDPEREICSIFKDRSRFVELPCKIGNKLYLSTESIDKIIHLLGTYESSPEIFEIVPEKQIKQALKERKGND